jgi:dTDP-4-dehydrorhamnose 3,5-epimerase
MKTELPGVILVEPRVFTDDRGWFFETWNGPRYQALGIPGEMRQDNVSFSTRGVVRGLHYQHPHAQGKLVSVLEGEIFDVAVDIRIGSPTFGHWHGVTLSAENHRQLYIPTGFAHGFCVTSAAALVLYKCTEVYRPECEASLLWNDAKLAIDWPVTEPRLSPKDRAAPCLSEVPVDRLPQFVES